MRHLIWADVDFQTAHPRTVLHSVLYKNYSDESAIQLLSDYAQFCRDFDSSEFHGTTFYVVVITVPTVAGLMLIGMIVIGMT